RSAFRSARACRAVAMTRSALPCTSPTSRSNWASAILSDCFIGHRRRCSRYGSIFHHCAQRRLLFACPLEDLLGAALPFFLVLAAEPPAAARLATALPEALAGAPETF